MHNNNSNPLVAIRCMTFNQKPYIRQCLDGFVMQKTNFPFVAIVVDDASTDNEQEVLWDFINNELDQTSLQKDETDDFVRVVAPHKINCNCTFVVVFLKYNHTSIKKAKKPYFKEWEDSAIYIALCEGDDYWIDPLKLQKQVDYLEAHPECGLVCNRVKRFSEKDKSFRSDSYCKNENGVLAPKDIIRRGGLYISTCSILYRKELLNNYPGYCRWCHVGDYPLQIMAGMKACTFYFNDAMSVYRVNNPLSWVGRVNNNRINDTYLNGVRTEVNMLLGFSNDFNDYKKVFQQRIAYFVTSLLYIYRNDTVSVNKINNIFHDEISNFEWLWKLRIYFIFHSCFGLRIFFSLFYKIFVKPKFE